MEMYADEESRGGVLEPEGIVNIKYRRDKQLETMARLDPTYGQLRARLADENLSPDQTSEVKLKMTEREKALGPVYLQIALQFADLHDRAGRMEAKGAIRMALKWQNARRFFYWRLRRKLSEEVLLKRLAGAAANVATNVTSASQKDNNINLLKSWTGLLDAEFDKDDRKVAEWYEGHRKEIYSKIDAVKSEGVSLKVAELLLSNKGGGLKGVKEVLSLVPTSERDALVKYLTGV
jgi:acetyl-CoA carboxylase / biotin carboxylase 1